MKKLYFLVAVVCLPFWSYSQNDTLPDLEAYFSTTIVQDMNKSLDWYTNTLGFEVLNKVVMEERGFKQANLKRGNVLMELIEINIALSPKDLLVDHPPKSKIMGFFKIGFLVPEFQKWVDILKQKNVSLHGNVVIDSISGKKMLIILDPDGNRIQLFEK